MSNPSEGASYTATAWVRTNNSATVGKPLRLHLRQRGGSTPELVTASSPVSVSTTWQQLSVTVTVGVADRTSLDIYLALSSAASGDRFAVDDVTLTEDDPIDITPPTAPSLSSAVPGNTVVALSWAASSDTGGSGLGGYRVFRNGTQVAQVGASTTSYTDSGLTNGTSYSYFIQAFDGESNVSPNSNSLSATPSAAPTLPGCTRFAATTGSDSNTGVDTAHPVRTISRANALAKPGDVWCFASGVYSTGNVTLGTSGTATAPITYRSTSGQGAILDGAGISIGSTGAILSVTGSYLTIANFEIRNSSGRGVSIHGVTGATVSGSKIHDTHYSSINMSGHFIKADGNEIYNGAMSNQGGHFGGASCSTGGWPAVLQTYFIWPNASNLTTDVTITNNYVHDSWGEGIDVISADRALVKGNRVKDTWSVLIYVDGARNVTVDGNHVSANNPTYFRCGGGAPATGITMAVELSDEPALANNLVVNNLVTGAGRGISFWNAGAGLGYTNLKIFNNTFWGTSQPAIRLDTSPGTPSGTMKNNLVFGTNSVSIGNGSWSITNNDFPNGVPAGVSSSTNFALNPALVAPAAGASPASFKVSAGSPIIGRGETRSEVLTDYFGVPRNSPPTIGFHEGQ